MIYLLADGISQFNRPGLLLDFAPVISRSKDLGSFLGWCCQKSLLQQLQ